MYTDMMEVPMTTGTATIDMTSTGDKARWNPGLNPVWVKGASVALNAAPGDAGVVKFDKRVTFGSDTGRGDGDVGVINLATTHTAGKTVVKYFTPVKISPGEEVVVEVTDASASVNAAKVCLLVEPFNETFDNNTKIAKST